MAMDSIHQSQIYTVIYSIYWLSTEMGNNYILHTTAWGMGSLVTIYPADSSKTKIRVFYLTAANISSSPTENHIQ